MIGKLLIIGPLALVLSIVVFRTVFIYKPLPPPEPCSHAAASTGNHQRIKLNRDILDRFKGALDLRTISYQVNQYEPAQLVKLIEFIESSFPAIHRAPFIKRERIANYTLLYTIEGANKSLRPYLLTSHMDVVPVVRDKWSSDPFKATLKEDNYLYARGTIDAKHLLMSMLEALEFMLTNEGFRPQRGLYLVFGHDEEIGGLEGAQAVARLLAERLRPSQTQQQQQAGSKWRLEYILDEGNVIAKSRVPGLDADIGFIGVVEKGFMTVKLSATGTVGHGSMPPKLTAISKLAHAVSKFHAHLMPSFLGEGVEREMIETFASYARWPYKLAYANYWLFKPVFEYVFSSDPAMNSLIRTSTAVTMIDGGTKENVLPDSASAYINHRVHQLQSCAKVLDYDREVVNDPTIQVEMSGFHSEPSPTAPYGDDSYGYQLIKQSVLQVYPGTVLVPATFLAASDSRWYTNLTDSIYKFSPIAVHMDEMNRFHGHDERISVENYENLINFYHHLIRNSDAVKLNFKPKQREEL